jgi:hypothetical protein
MVKSFKSPRSPWVLLLLLIVGALAGSALAEALAPVLPLVKATKSFGLSPTTLDLNFLKVTFGINIALGPLTVLGLIVGYWVYRRI